MTTTEEAYAAFDAWRARWTAEHDPEGELDLLELIDVYYEGENHE